MHDLAFPMTAADRLILRHFRNSLPKHHRTQFDASVADLMETETRFAVDRPSQQHILMGSCAVCAYHQWRAYGLDETAAKTAVGHSITNYSNGVSRFLIWLWYRLSKDPFEATRKYTAQIDQIYGATFDIAFSELEDGFVSVVKVCGYKTFLARQDAEHLLDLFCEWDRVWIDGIPKGIRFVRPSTIAQGAETCRFEFRRE